MDVEKVQKFEFTIMCLNLNYYLNYRFQFLFPTGTKST